MNIKISFLRTQERTQYKCVSQPNLLKYDLYKTKLIFGPPLKDNNFEEILRSKVFLFEPRHGEIWFFSHTFKNLKIIIVEKIEPRVLQMTYI